jgi:hypothetical protein
MQTNFTEKQLKDSDNAATEKILKSVFIVVFVMQLVQPIKYLVTN